MGPGRGLDVSIKGVAKTCINEVGKSLHSSLLPGGHPPEYCKRITTLVYQVRVMSSHCLLMISKIETRSLCGGMCTDVPGCDVRCTQSCLQPDPR